MQEDDDAKRAFLIPKLNTGINVYDQLYIKKEKGLARLVEDSVALVEEDNQGPLKSRQAVVLKESKIEGKRLSRKERQQEREKTAGKGWFDMPKPEMTPEMKRDLQVLKMRHVIDPKRHYKKFGKGEDPKYFQTGTIIEGPTEFFSSRINRKDRKQTFVDELLADETARSYHKRKHLEAQSRGRNGRKKMKREMKRL
ncbi:Fcf2 pre-rRNA processing-domain-containing protein [Dichotomocladium elegans]|nr:Fcf2 pre-rRNA processing-domain-containing protein [Dichotomocladium elegans]